MRGATNEDLSVVVKRVVFQLHSSFNNPMRVVESPPFELSESGWAEFEIAIILHFHSDVCEKPPHLLFSLFTTFVIVLFAHVQNRAAVNVCTLPGGIILPPSQRSIQIKNVGNS